MENSNKNKKRKLSIKKETIQEMDKYFEESATNLHGGICDIPTIDVPSPNDDYGCLCGSCSGPTCITSISACMPPYG